MVVAEMVQEDRWLAVRYAERVVATVRNEDVAYRSRRVVDGEDFETTPEEWVDRISNLDLLGEGQLV